MNISRIRQYVKVLQRMSTRTFLMQLFVMEKWLSIILKLGRYGTAARAFFQFAREVSFFLNPSAFIRVFKRTLKMASKVVIFGSQSTVK
jgi:hypothetical protein